MSEGILSKFLDGAGDRPYKELVQAHIRKQSTSKLQQAVSWETSNLPKSISAQIESFIAAINERFAYDNDFWKEVTCLEAFTSFMLTAFEFLPINDRIKSIEASFESENQEIAFQIFQIATLSFAYSASTQKKQRKFMGIRKGLFR
jgi:DNA primase large subunit